MPNKRIQKIQSRWALIVGAALGLSLAQWTAKQINTEIEQQVDICAKHCELRAGRHLNDLCPCGIEEQ